MAKLPGSIFLKDSDKETEILTFEKPPGTSEKDTEEGVSRFGGFMRQPSYSQAYFKAAKIVLDKALHAEELDELGLPIFYLVRHTVELKLKSLLAMAYDILDMAMVCYPTEYTPDKVPSRGQRDRLNKSHNLERLFSDLEKSCSTLNINIPEKQFVAVIDLIKEYEVNPTWSRYSSSGHGAHVENEVQLPIVQSGRD